MRRLAAQLALLLLLAGCGLPVDGGVHRSGAVPVAQGAGGDIQVLPPGPRNDAPADEIVRDFFGAQSDPSNGHGSARDFLAPEFRVRWHDTGPVSVFGGELAFHAVAPDAFRVTGSRVGSIRTDGSYDPGTGRVDVVVTLRRGPGGRWLITSVPDGLLLSTADRDRSFRPHDVYFLAPADRTDPTAPRHLVADPLFLPVDAGSADPLVRRLLQGPSVALRGAVATAFPPGTIVRSVRTEASGLVTVDLSGGPGKASPQLQEQMSAQLVWSLRTSSDGFSRLRLLSAGRQIQVAGTNGDQDSDSWASYDPNGLPADAAAFCIVGRRLRLLDPSPGPPPGVVANAVVDVAAVSPRGGAIALITRNGAEQELRVGPSGGPFALRARSTSLSFPSWGSGERGLFFIDQGRLRLAPNKGGLVDVPVDRIASLGGLSGVRVSRDGVRVALIAGTGRNASLIVGRIQQTDSGLRVVGVTAVAPDMDEVRDLSWDGATSVVVLGRILGVLAPVRVAVDGSSLALISRFGGLELSTPRTIAAAPLRPVVVGAADQAGRPLLLRDSGLIYVPVKGIAGSAPFYPG